MNSSYTISLLSIISLLFALGCAEVQDEVELSTVSQALEGDFFLVVPPLEVGSPADMYVTGAAADERVVLVRGTDAGAGSCPASLGGECLGVTGEIAMIGRSRADADGEAGFHWPVPPGAPEGLQFCMQAFIKRGAGGADSIMSNVVCSSTCSGADGCDFCPADTDSDGICDHEDDCPDDETDSCLAEWFFANYPDADGWDPGVQWNGEISCTETCGAMGRESMGARFICNLWGTGPTEGCDDTNDGLYGDANCGWMVQDGVAMTLNGNTEDCAGGNIMGCVTDTCTEGVTYHAIECQCSDEIEPPEPGCADADGDGICNSVDPCPEDETDSCPAADWIFANYPEADGWDASSEWNGTVSCGETCGAIGEEAVGARFICNLWGTGPTEGCNAANDGEYGNENCGWMMMDGVEMTLNGNTEDCAGDISSCVSGSCTEGVTYHALECQCTDEGIDPGCDDADGDGVCDVDDPCPEDETDSCAEADWVFANYSGASDWDPAVQWNGEISCPVTCDALGKTALGARFICNLWGTGPTEGCDDSNDGLYGDANCGWMVQDGVAMTLNGNTEDCAGGNIMGCVTDSCSEGVTYHAIECQCSSEDCDDFDGDGVCDLADICEGFDDTIDSDGDGAPDGCDECPLDPLDSDGDGICDSMDLCPFAPDTDGDGVCDDVDPCPYDFPDDTDSDGLCDTVDPCPEDETDSCPGADWVFANYPGASGWDPAVQWNGEISCPVTCDALGKTALGARFICNLWGTGPTEGCDDSNDGFYGDANCGWMVQDGVAMTLNGNTEDCAGGNIMGCVTDSCSEGVTYHAIECQCSSEDCSDIDNDGVCDLADICEGWDDTIDSDGDGTPDGCDECPLDPLDSDGDGICDSMDLCPFAPDTDGDGVCDDVDPCPYDFPDDTDSDGLCDTVDPCPDDETDSCPGADWVFANYPGASGWDPAVQWNGEISCPETCGAIGKTAQGARFICNLWGTGPTEGCDDSNDGFYGDANCGWMVQDGVAMTLNGNTEDCAGGNIMGCVTDSCSEGVTYHAIECQCN